MGTTTDGTLTKGIFEKYGIQPAYDPETRGAAVNMGQSTFEIHGSGFVIWWCDDPVLVQLVTNELRGRQLPYTPTPRGVFFITVEAIEAALECVLRNRQTQPL